MSKVATALAAAAVLLITTGVASARSGISMSPTSTTLTYTNIEFEGGIGTPIRCNWTLDLAFHARTSKSVGSLTGFADLTMGACSEGSIGILDGGRRVTGAQGPYHLTYRSFTGTLPNITSLTFRLNDVTFWIELPGFTDCLTNGAVDIDSTTTGGNPITGARMASQNVPMTGEFLCIFSAVELNGSGSLSSSVRMTLF